MHKFQKVGWVLYPDDKHLNSSLSPGFTLAEVLITLGIIGVVAAMTLPTVLNKVQDIQYKAAAKKAFSVSSEVVAHMKRDEGGTLNTYLSTSQSFKPVFMTYFKVIKDCGWSSCVPSTVASDLYTSITGAKANTGFSAEGQFVTSDGMFWGFYNQGNQYLMIVVDVNGYTKKPNVYGKDTFVFEVLNNALLPGGANGSPHYTTSTTSGYCNKTGTIKPERQGMGCMSIVMQGIDY